MWGNAVEMFSCRVLKINTSFVNSSRPIGNTSHNLNQKYDTEAEMDTHVSERDTHLGNKEI